MTLEDWLKLALKVLAVVEDASKVYLDPNTPNNQDKLRSDIVDGLAGHLDPSLSTIIAGEVVDFLDVAAAGQGSAARATTRILAIAESRNYPIGPLAQGLISGMMAQLEMMAGEHRLGK